MHELLIPLAGGLLIGSSALLLLVMLGRIAGVSGILWNAVSAAPDNLWRWMFILGLLLGPVLYHTLAGVAHPAPNPSPWWLAVVAGLLVGFGVRLGSGCTSGHGVCGLGRLSPRSLAATITFMLTGILTVFLLRHIVGGL